MRRIRRFKISDLFIGFVFTILFLSLGVVFTVNFRPLYYLDVKLLNIPEISGYPKEIIIENYNALIDYSSPFIRAILSSLAGSIIIRHSAFQRGKGNFYLFLFTQCRFINCSNGNNHL